MEDFEKIVKKYTDICIDRCFNPWIFANKEKFNPNKPIEDAFDNYTGDYGLTQLGDIILEEMTKQEKISIIIYFYDIDDLYDGIGTDEDDSPALYLLSNVEMQVTDVLSHMHMTVEQYTNQIER